MFLGVVPMLLAIVGLRRYRTMRTSWLLAGVAFAVLAIGPALHIAGRRCNRAVVHHPAEHAILPLPLADARSPDFYTRLRDEPGRAGVLEVPIPDDPSVFPQRMLYQTVHAKPTYGGYLARGLPPLAFDGVPGFSQFKTQRTTIDDVVAYDAMSLAALSAERR